MSVIFRKPIKYVKNGEAVSAPVTNRPISDVAANLQAVTDRLELFGSGSQLALADVTVDPACQVGSPVVYRTDKFVPAVVDPGAGLFRADGVVLSKLSAAVATIVLSGVATIDLSAVTDDTDAGVYYLTGIAGRLSTTPSVWPVPVLLRMANDEVLVYGASQVAGGASHEHRSAYLPHHRTAGGEAGWEAVALLPGQPAGAQYKYVNSAFVDQIAAGYVGGSTWSATQFDGDGRGLELDDTVIVLNNYGLWWLGDFPPGDPNGSASSDSGGPRRLRLSTFASPYSTGTVVRTLVGQTGGPIRVTNCDGGADPFGNLKVEFDDSLAVGVTDRTGYLAFKGYQGGKIASGPVVEGLKAGNSSVLLTGPTAPVDPLNLAAGVMHVGVTEVRANLNPDGRVVLPQTVRLDDLRQRYLDGIDYLAMPPDRTSSGVYKLRMPGSDAVVGSPTFTLSVVFYAEGTGTLPAVVVGYKRLPRPGASGGSGTPPVSFTAVTFPSSGTAVTAGNYVRIDSSPIAGFAADDVLVFQIARSAPDGYTAHLGLMDVVGVLDTP